MATVYPARFIYESHTADFTTRVEHAQRADGEWFTRLQYRDPRYGYKWTSWRITAGKPDAFRLTARRANLPKAVA